MQGESDRGPALQSQFICLCTNYMVAKSKGVLCKQSMDDSSRLSLIKSNGGNSATRRIYTSFVLYKFEEFTINLNLVQIIIHLALT